MLSKSLFVAAAMLASVSTASARNCVVTDPTGTELNVRNSPAGDIVATMPNGRTVKLLGTRTDRSGKLWANILPEGYKIDVWVFREFLSCL